MSMHKEKMFLTKRPIYFFYLSFKRPKTVLVATCRISPEDLPFGRKAKPQDEKEFAQIAYYAHASGSDVNTRGLLRHTQSAFFRFRVFKQSKINSSM